MNERPYWCGWTGPKRFDIAELRLKASGSKGWFETESDARALSDRYLAATSGLVREVLHDCRNGYYVCGRPHCPICSRAYRRWFFAQAARIVDSVDLERCRFLTIYLDTVPAGELDQANLKRLHDALRQRLRRCGFSGTTIIGGTEFGYRYATNSWLLHVHLLVMDPGRLALQKLHARYPDRLLKVEHFRDPVKQLSYLQKFATYHRPFPRTGPQNAVAVPIPAAALRELLAYSARLSFDDLLFLVGARRRKDWIEALNV